MKNFIIILTLIFFAGTTACKKYLVEDGSKQLTSDALKDPIGFDNALTGVYSQLRNYYGHNATYTLTESGIDAFTNSSVTTEPNFFIYSKSGLNPQHAMIQTQWNNAYIAVNRANAVIELGATVQGLSTGVVRIKVAEARFLRALFYFNLVRTWGDVPLHLSSTTSLVTDGTRTPRKDVYKAIINDLDSAVLYLPYTQTDYGRVTRFAAFHLLAKVYLTKGWLTDTAEPQDFNKAVQFADSVILKKPALSNATLSFKTIWDENSSNATVSPEILLTVQYVSAQNNQIYNVAEGTADPNLNTIVQGNEQHLFFLWKYDTYDKPVLIRDIFNGRPFGYFRITNNALALFDQVHDSRYKYTFESVYYCNKAGKNKKGNTVAIGDTAIWFPGKELTPAQVAAKRYDVILPSMYTSINYPSVIKFRDSKRQVLSNVIGKRDIFLFRLAETYLISAEAYFKLNDNVNAAAKLNAVRTRAAYPGSENEMVITPANVTIDFILDERIRELCAEGERWYDLTRTHSLVRRCNSFNPNILAAGFIKDEYELRPIPQSEIDLSYGTSIQNPGYDD